MLCGFGSIVGSDEESGLKEAEDFLRQTVQALQRRYGFKDSLTLRATSDLVFVLERQGKDAEEWRQRLPDTEENDMAFSQEGLEDCEDPETAEILRDLLAKRRLREGKVVSSLSSSSTTGAAPISSITRSQLFHVVSEAASSSTETS